MKKVGFFILLLFMMVFNLTACTNNISLSKSTKVEESFFKSGSDDSNSVELQKVKDNIWVHTSYSNYNGSRTPSNGVIAVTSKGLILVDTPWNEDQTRELIELTKRIFKKDISLAVITHAHEDRIGGINALAEKKIDVRSTDLTAKAAEKNGFKSPQTRIESNAKINWEDTAFEVFYPGAGHTADNITVWFSQYKVLFAGCIIKSLESGNIGNTEDANVNEWPVSVRNVLEKYPDAEVVIPGHGKWGSLELVNHTLELLGK